MKFWTWLLYGDPLETREEFLAWTLCLGCGCQFPSGQAWAEHECAMGFNATTPRAATPEDLKAVPACTFQWPVQFRRLDP